MDHDELVARARDAVEDSYAPYSDYEVGAALETASGDVYTGCNIENANYSNSLHAEEVAVAAAYKDGHREFTRIAVSTRRRDGVTPCGMCRQTLVELCSGDLVVVCDEGDAYAEYALDDLIPNTITPETLAATGDADE